MKFIFASVVFGSFFFLPIVDVSASTSTATETNAYPNTTSTKIAKAKGKKSSKRPKNRTACFSVGAPTYSWVCTKP
jgi:hypothetical protein